MRSTAQLIGKTASRCRSAAPTVSPPPQPHRLLSVPATASASQVTFVPTSPLPTELLYDLRDLLKSYPLLEETSWGRRLDNALVDLKQFRRPRIAVLGDKDKGASALVSAAFDDPLSSDKELSVALASRRLGNAPEAVTLRYGDPTRIEGPSAIAIPSAWLRNSDIIEILHDGAPLQQSSLDSLYSSDALVFLVSETWPPTSPSLRALLLEHVDHSRVFVVVDSQDPSHAATARNIERELASFFGEAEHPEVVVVSTEMAMMGLAELLPEDPREPVSWTRFQAEYNGSGVPKLKDQLADAVADGAISEGGGPSVLQGETANYVLEKATRAATFQAAELDDMLSMAAADIEALALVGNREAQETLESLGVKDGALKVPEEDLQSATEKLKVLLAGRLAWWKLPARSDDITSEIAVAVESSYLREFEDRLIFDTGRLISLSSTFAKQTDELLSTPAFSPDAPPLASLYSAVFLNRLEQAAIESSKVSSTALSTPLVNRRSQITAPGGPAEVLQARVQRSIASTFTLSGASVSAGVASQLIEYADLATNFGVGLFGTVLAAWMLQRGWNKSKKKFFIDVDQRVKEGLDDDLGAAAQRLVDRSLFKLRTAVVLSEDKVRKRRAEFSTFAKALAALEKRREDASTR